MRKSRKACTGHPRRKTLLCRFLRRVGGCKNRKARTDAGGTPAQSGNTGHRRKTISSFAQITRASCSCPWIWPGQARARSLTRTGLEKGQRSMGLRCLPHSDREQHSCRPTEPSIRNTRRSASFTVDLERGNRCCKSEVARSLDPVLGCLVTPWCLFKRSQTANGVGSSFMLGPIFS